MAALGTLVIGGAVAGVGIGGFGWMIAQSGNAIVQGSPETVVAKIRSAEGTLMQVRRRHLAESVLGRTREGELSLDLRFKNGSARFEGREAQRIAAIVIPKVNRFGGNRRDVGEAVREIETTGGPEGYLDRLSRMSQEYTRTSLKRGDGWWRRRASPRELKHGLYGLPSAHRLAFEMALHEEAERRALAGELRELERAWQDAEEIAAISDNLLVPENVDQAMLRLKKAD